MNASIAFVSANDGDSVQIDGSIGSSWLLSHWACPNLDPMSPGRLGRLRLHLDDEPFVVVDVTLSFGIVETWVPQVK